MKKESIALQELIKEYTDIRTNEGRSAPDLSEKIQFLINSIEGAYVT